MSKTVMIPDNMRPFECNINGKKYRYPAGTEQTVPDEVAMLIQYGDTFPPKAPETDPPYSANEPLDVTDSGIYIAPKGKGYSPVSVNVQKAAKPYIEYTYDANGNMIAAKLYGCTKIEPYQFYNQTHLVSVDFSESPSLASIGQYAFQYCTSLALTSLPESITSISSSAFNGCTSLVNMEVRCSKLGTGTKIFENCTGLRKVWFRSSCVTVTASSAATAPFVGCSTALQIYAEPASKPSGWSAYFDRTGSSGGTTVTVTYGQTTRPW